MERAADVAATPDSGSVGGSRRTRSNAGLTDRGSGRSDVSEDIWQSHDLPLRQQLHRCPGSLKRHMGQAQAASSRGLGCIAIMDIAKLPTKRTQIIVAVTFLIAAAG